MSISTEHYDETAPVNIYIANLRKYNEGELVGGWLSLPQDEDDISEFIGTVVGIDCEHEEWAIHDWESDYFDRIDEYDSIWALNEKAERIEGLNGYEEQTLKAAIEVFGQEAWELDLDELVLLDGVHTEWDLGYYWAVDSGCYELKDNSPLSRYFDYEAFGRDIAIETNGGLSSYVCIEYSG